MDLQTIANGRTAYPIRTLQYYPNTIRAIQTALNQLGFSAGNVDGTWNQTTDSAFRDFVKRYRFNEGELSPRGAQLLLDALPRGGVSAPAPSPAPRPAPSPAPIPIPVPRPAPVPSPAPRPTPTPTSIPVPAPVSRTPAPSVTPRPAPTSAAVTTTISLQAIANGITPYPINTIRNFPDVVRVVQTALNRMGFSVGTADGQWGSRTDTAYRIFAQRYGFNPTEISPRAASFLIRAAGSAAPPSPTPAPPSPTPAPPRPSPSPPSPSPSGSFNEALRFTLQWEGGYVNHPNDYGGATNKGVIQRVYDDYRRRKGLPLRSVAFITDAEVEEIYQVQYWQASQAPNMSRALAIVHFDTAVNFGVTGAILFLQETLGVSADGVFGSMTRAALDRANNSTTARRYVQGRIDYRYLRVQQDPSQRVFLQGWLNRDNALQRYIANIA